MTTTTAVQPLDLDRLEALAKATKNGRPSADVNLMMAMDAETTLALIAQARTAKPAGAAASPASASIYVRKATLDHIAASSFVKHEITVRTEPNEGWVALAAQPVQAGEAAHSITFAHEVDGPWRLELNFVTISRHAKKSDLEQAIKDLRSALGRASLAPVSAQQGAAVQTFDDWWVTPDATTGHPPAATLDPYSARNAWDAAQLAAYFAKDCAAKAPAAQAVGRRVTYVPTRGKKGVMQVTAWGPADMVLPAHRRIIEDVALYAASPASTPEAAPTVPEKAMFWFSCLTKCARLLNLSDEEPIPSGVVAAVEKLVAAPTAGAAMTSEDARDAVLDPVEGDLLPTVGSKVLIHLGRQDAWVEHTVAGYYVWGALAHQVREGEKNAHRVFVRVRDAEGYDNARLLSEVRPVAPGAPEN